MYVTHHAIGSRFITIEIPSRKNETYPIFIGWICKSIYIIELQLNKAVKKNCGRIIYLNWGGSWTWQRCWTIGMKSKYQHTSVCNFFFFLISNSFYFLLYFHFFVSLCWTLDRLLIQYSFFCSITLHLHGLFFYFLATSPFQPRSVYSLPRTALCFSIFPAPAL